MDTDPIVSLGSQTDAPNFIPQNEVICNATGALTVQRERIHHTIAKAYEEYGHDNFEAFFDGAIKAYEMAKSFPIESDQLVVEAYLLAANACALGMRSALVSDTLAVPDAIELLNKTAQLVKEGDWIDPTFEVRHEILNFQLTYTNKYNLGAESADEIHYLTWLHELQTTTPLAANQIVMLSNHEALAKHNEKLDTLAFYLMERTLGFAQQNPNIEKSLIIRTYINYGFSLGRMGEFNDGSITLRQSERFIDQGIAALRKADTLNDSNYGPLSWERGEIQLKLLALHLKTDKINLDDALEARDNLRAWLNSYPAKIDAYFIGEWIAVEQQFFYRQRDLRDESEFNALQYHERSEITRQYDEAMLPLFQQAIRLINKIPAEEQDPKQLEDYTYEVVNRLLEIGEPTEALALLETIKIQPRALLTQSEENFMRVQFRALVSAGEYRGAQRLAEAIIADNALKDPMKVFRAHWVDGLISVAGALASTSPDWAAKLFDRARPDMLALSYGGQIITFNYLARLSYLTGKFTTAYGWLERIDEARARSIEEYQSKNSTLDEEEADEGDNMCPDAAFSILEILNRATLELDKGKEAHADVAERLLEIIREAREDSIARRESFPSTLSEMYSLDAKYNLMLGHVDTAEILYHEALDALHPNDRTSDFQRAQNIYGLATVELSREPANYRASTNHLRNALTLHETFVSPTKLHALTLAQLVENYGRLGETQNAELMRVKLQQVVAQVNSIPEVSTELPPFVDIPDEL